MRGIYEIAVQMGSAAMNYMESFFQKLILEAFVKKGLRKPQKSSVRIPSVLTEIRTKYLINTNLELYF